MCKLCVVTFSCWFAVAAVDWAVFWVGTVHFSVESGKHPQNTGNYAQYIYFLWQEKWAAATGNSNSTSKKAHKSLKMTNLKKCISMIKKFVLIQFFWELLASQLYMTSQHTFQKVYYVSAEREMKRSARA